MIFYDNATTTLDLICFVQMAVYYVYMQLRILLILLKMQPNKFLSTFTLYSGFGIVPF